MDLHTAEPTQTSTRPRPLVLAWYCLAAVLAVITYFYALDSDHIPKNGDEYPYMHITRLTAASGHLLPLQSELENMRNTKPPLLFWQGIASTNWGRNWSLWHLRYPSVIYTLLTGLMVFLLAVRLARSLETGFLALLVFLAFFSTYRYGRPFLTNPPEVFWLFMPFFVLLYGQPRSFESRFAVPLLLGASVGIGLLYKSFALLMPVGLALTWWYWRQRGYRLGTFLVRDSWKLALVGCLALAVFSLWFILDPNPKAIWREFVLGENMKKFDPGGPSYLSQLLWGDSSIWRLVLGYPLDAGLLAVPLVALFFISIQRHGEMSDAEKLLWIWVITLFVVFSLPSQRDERYLLAGMPALAVLCALSWHRIDRKFFLVTLIAAGAVVVLLAYLSLRLEYGITGVRVYSPGYWVLLGIAGVVIVLGLFRLRLTTPLLNVAVLLVYLIFAAFTRPLDLNLGQYSRETQEYARGKDVWVPTNFRAKEEAHRFFLPGVKLHAYTRDPSLTVSALGARFPLFAITVPILSPDVTPAEGKVIGQRLDIGGRHNSSQIKAMVLGKVYENLFIKELLIEAPVPAHDFHTFPE